MTNQPLINTLQAEVTGLQQLVNQLESAVRRGPNGSLHIAVSPEVIDYYRHLPDKDHYISKKNHSLVVELAQKDYNRHVLATAKKELYALQDMLTECQVLPRLESCYEKLTPERKALVQPIVLPKDAFREQWLATADGRHAMKGGAPALDTDAGIRVHSKSAVNLCNAAFRGEVPFKYQCPVWLPQDSSLLDWSNYNCASGTIHASSSAHASALTSIYEDLFGQKSLTAELHRTGDKKVKLYPTLTLLDESTRTEYYWHHFEDIDTDIGFAAFQKSMRQYNKSGLFRTGHLIVTVEGSHKPIRSQEIETILAPFEREWEFHNHPLYQLLNK